MFKLMGLYTINKQLINHNGLKFLKLLGTGSRDGFSFIPDFSNYILISTWDDDSNRENFLNKNKIINEMINNSSKRVEIKIDPYSSKGSWNGVDPFKSNSYYKNGKMAVITRARVKFKKLLNFLISTSVAAKSIKTYKGADYYKGIGELPIIEQATLSIWENEGKMKSYAYSNENHLKIISKARKDKWYSEELFVRSNVVSIKEY
tara:strand:+ start:139 stop:753 length:615 start_codon:yes stop_codon:yes gene_type:complete